MKKRTTRPILQLIALGGIFSVLVAGNCNKNDDIPLPQIGGYNNSNEVGSANLLAHWGFEGNGNERKSNTAPTASVNATFVPGVKGQAVSLNKGYLYYASELTRLTSNQAFTVTAWVQVTNTQGTGPGNDGPQIYFQSAVPGKLFGNVSTFFETSHFKPVSDTLRLKSIYADVNNGNQDNINAFGPNSLVVKGAGQSRWIKVTTIYQPVSAAANHFRIWADTTEVALDYFNRGTASFKNTSPSEVIIGGWYNNIPGKTVTPDTWTIPFTGKIDELRVYDKALSQAELTALFKLEQAGR